MYQLVVTSDPIFFLTHSFRLPKRELMKQMQVLVLELKMMKIWTLLYKKYSQRHRDMEG